MTPRKRISLGAWQWAVKKLEVGCQFYAVMKQLVKLIDTDNGSNRLVAPEAMIRNPNASSLH